MPYRACVNAMPDPVIVCDTDAQILHANALATALISLPTGISSGMSLYSLIHPDHLASFDKAVKSAIKSPERRITGELRIGRAMGFGNNVSYSLSCTHTLTDERPRLLFRLSPFARSAASRDANRFDELVKRMYDVYYRTDAAGVIEIVSPSIRNFLGYNPDEVIGHRLADYYQTPSQRDDFLAAMKTAGYVIGYEAPMVAKDGSVRWVSTSAHFIHDDAGNVVGVEGIGRDITERKRAEADLLEANSRLERQARQVDEMNRMLESRISRETGRRIAQEQLLLQRSKLSDMGEMMGAIAHQWRQPLSALALLVQDMVDAAQFGDLDAEYLTTSSNQMMDQIHYMNRTIEDFRNFHRPDREVTDFNVAKALRQVLTLISPQMRMHGIDLTVEVVSDDAPVCTSVNELPPDSECSTLVTEKLSRCIVRGVAGEYQQVILALTENSRTAILATHGDSGGPRQVKVRLDCTNTTIITRISDTGGGIPDSALPHIFDPWFTTRKDKGGTGIGLSVAKTIVEENMGGAISVENDKHGAVFTLALPAR